MSDLNTLSWFTSTAVCCTHRQYDSQVIGWKASTPEWTIVLLGEKLRTLVTQLHCVCWDVKPCSTTTTSQLQPKTKLVLSADLGWWATSRLWRQLFSGYSLLLTSVDIGLTCTEITLCTLPRKQYLMWFSLCPKIDCSVSPSCWLKPGTTTLQLGVRNLPKVFTRQRPCLTDT